MDNLVILTDQHKTLRGMLNTLGRLGDAVSRNRVIRQIQTEIDFHFFLEESIVFPSLGKFSVLTSWSSLLWETHEKIKTRIEGLRESAQDNVAFSLAFRVFNNEVDAHFSDEETHVFPSIRSVVPNEELNDIGRKLRSALAEKQHAA